MSIHPLNSEVHQALINFMDEGRACALAMILNGSGTIPRPAGTKASVDASGAIWGTVGGGLLEAETQRRAVQAIQAGCPTLFDFRFAGSSGRL